MMLLIYESVPPCRAEAETFDFGIVWSATFRYSSDQHTMADAPVPATLAAVH